MLPHTKIDRKRSDKMPKGMAGFVLAKGSLTSKTNGEGETRKAIIEAGTLHRTARR